MYALDRLPEPHPDFHVVAEKAKTQFNSKFEYRQIDVRDVEGLHKTVEEIANVEGRMDGLVAAAGIQQETPALEYTAEDANRMFEVNITGVFMTAQAVAKQMIKFGNGGSMVFIASMSGTVANRVRVYSHSWIKKGGVTDRNVGTDLCCVQLVKGRCDAASSQPGCRMGSVQHPRQHHLARIHCNADGGGVVCQVSGAQGVVAYAEHAGTAVSAQGIPRCGGVLGQRRQLVHDWRGSEDRRRPRSMVDSPIEVVIL